MYRHTCGHVSSPQPPGLPAALPYGTHTRLESPGPPTAPVQLPSPAQEETTGPPVSLAERESCSVR